MSETLNQDTDGLVGTPYIAPSYPPTPATPSSTVQEAPPGANLPPFSTFSNDMDSTGAFNSVSDRLFSDTRLLDISNWDYYTETRLLERGENGLSIISSQPQYRPWESKSVDATSAFAPTTQINTFADAFSAQQNGASKLPSFQSQFQTFNEAVATSEPTTLTTLTNLTPVSPNSSSSPHSQSLTTLNSNFHTLSSVQPRGYPLVPAPIQAREIPSIQQQFLDERHIQLYSHPINNTIHSASIFPAQNGAIIQNNQLISSPTVVTVIKSEPDLKLTTDSGIKVQNIGLHHTQFQNPLPTIHNSDTGLYNGIEKKLNGTSVNANMTSPTRNDFRKKERRKIRASSLESSAESDGASSNMDLGAENSGQVAAVSSTDGFKTHAMEMGMQQHEISGGSVDKQVKKKRKRCGECIGCQRKDNCGDCAPCRNDKSHQICKQRRCEKLTEKKNLYGEPYMRGESRRGRGKGRGGASYRGRKPSGPIVPLTTPNNLAVPPEVTGVPPGVPQQPPTRPSPQPATVQQAMPVQQNPMTPMPFYADPNRFTTPVWQAEPAQGWTQGQFIQQIPPSAQPIETYQQYPGSIYQATYQQPTFETNTFYTGAVQVLTNARPPSVPNQQPQMVPPRPNSNYAHTPSPSPAQQNQGQQQTNGNRQQYQEYNQFSGSTSTNENNSSRPSSVNSVANQNPPTPNNQNFGQPNQGNTVFTAVSTGDFSPNSNSAQYINSGNAEPGYPQVTTNSPQVVSHNSSGYPGSEEYGGQPQQQQQQQQQWQQQEQQHQQQMMWEHPDNNKIDQNYHQDQNNQDHYMTQQQNLTTSPSKMHNESMQNSSKPFSQADKVNLNTRIKTMILNKQQNDSKPEEVKPVDQNPTGHFLWYSHHHHLKRSSVDGGPKSQTYADYNNHNDGNTQNFAQNMYSIPHNEIIQRNFDNNSQKNNFLYNQKSKMLNDTQEINDSTGSLSTEAKNMEALNQIVNELSNQINTKEEDLWITAPETTLGYSTNPASHISMSEAPSQKFALPPFKQIYSQSDTPPQTPDEKYFLPHLNQAFKIPHASFATPERQFHYLNNSASIYRTQNQSLSPKREDQKYVPSSFLTPPKTPDTNHYFFPEPKPKPKIKEKQNETTKLGEEIPACNCLPPNQSYPEPGTYYTHLGCANNLKTLRHNLECQTGQTGVAIRIEKVNYTGKEGKTAQGCPIAKWIIRRVTLEEKYLVIVKHRRGHHCHSAYIVIGLVVWEGVPNERADHLYTHLTEKLNKFGVPTKRRCGTNDLRTCACQGINEDTCGASFSFGCSWSMYYNGCKFTRSKEVRKFRLNVKEEEKDLEDKLDDLANFISPMYRCLAPQSFKNQCLFENIASDCRLGSVEGRPFSGVTACMDFCAHAHKDIQNMINGCTVVVTLLKHRGLSKPDQEQLHVLPMYVLDNTDENGSEEKQREKVDRGQIEVLCKYSSEVRTCSIPTPSCKKLRKETEIQQRKKRQSTSQLSSPSISSTTSLNQPVDQPFPQTSEIQNRQVSSTVLDNPNPMFRYDPFYQNTPSNYQSTSSNVNCLPSNQLPHFSVFKNHSFNDQQFSNHYSHNGFLQPTFYQNNPSSYSFQQNPYNYPQVHNSFNNNSFSFPQIPNNLVPFQPPRKEKLIDIKQSDNTECFSDSEIGGVAIALPHGSVMFECAKHELHATTALKNPDRRSPTRVSLVFYQHRNLNKHQHGLDEYTLKAKRKSEGEKDEPNDSNNVVVGGSVECGSDLSVDLVPKVNTFPTVSWHTTFPMYPCVITGPYQEHGQEQ